MLDILRLLSVLYYEVNLLENTSDEKLCRETEQKYIGI